MHVYECMGVSVEHVCIGMHVGTKGQHLGIDSFFLQGALETQ